MSLERSALVVVCVFAVAVSACSSEGVPSLAGTAGSSSVTAGSAGIGVGAGAATGGSTGVGGVATGGTSVTTGGSSVATGGTAGSPVFEGDDLFGSAIPGEKAGFDSAPHSLTPTGLWGQLRLPLPTNAWWENLALNKGESPVNIFPYMAAASGAGLRVCQPERVTEANFTFSVFADNWVMTASEAFTERSIVAYDDLSVTLGWKAGAGEMVTPLVQGMPYVSARYKAVHPRLTTSHAISSLNGASGTSVTADHFEVQLNNQQTWRVYAQKPLTWSWQGQQLTASEAYDGWLRVARVTPELGTLLDEHAASIPTGGSVHAKSSGDVAGLTFAWQTEGTGEPLMMAMPHHYPTLKTALLTASLPTIRGGMRAVVGKEWQFEEPLTKLSWNSGKPIPAERKAEILTALKSDAQTVVPVADTPYFFGKQVAAVARLALIADELGESALAKELSGKLAGYLEPWLAGGAGSRLIYDTSWGGLVSRPGIADAGADFGLGYYNDHHFQYGYFIYAAAVIAHFDPTWVEPHRSAVEVVLRDFASPKADGYFPAYRCKDWFAGHSWAAGVFEFADSRNQESTSEAVNGYYAAYLWGLATNDARMRDFGRLLLATEIRSAQTYWQIKDTSIYPEPFASGKIVGVLWATKADHTTWFGNNLEFIHGIQWMPFTPMSEELLPRDWISETYPIVSSAFTRTDPVMGEGWRGLVYMAHAITDANAAWNEVKSLQTFDDGNSRTNALYWVATR
jgi:endo-1,3(4)-beta-glucanase